MTVHSACSTAVDSEVDDGFASLWQDHLAPLVIGIVSPAVQNLMCFRMIRGSEANVKVCATKSEGKGLYAATSGLSSSLE